VDAFRTVVKNVPLNEVWNNLGAAQSRRNDPDALASFEKAVEGDPADPDYQFNAGYALLRRGENEKAAERFRAVLDRRPDDAEATAMLGRSLRKTPARSAPAPSEGVERLKETYEESAWLQLKSLVEPKRVQEKSSKP
jgi:Flp pilus assembly protein TadD